MRCNGSAGTDKQPHGDVPPDSSGGLALTSRGGVSAEWATGRTTHRLPKKASHWRAGLSFSGSARFLSAHRRPPVPLWHKRCGSTCASTHSMTACVDANHPRRPGRRNIETGSRPSRRAWRSASCDLNPSAFAVAAESMSGPHSTTNSRVMLCWIPEDTPTPP
jgi:hypothetical protein